MHRDLILVLLSCFFYYVVLAIESDGYGYNDNVETKYTQWKYLIGVYITGWQAVAQAFINILAFRYMAAGWVDLERHRTHQRNALPGIPRRLDVSTSAQCRLHLLAIFMPRAFGL